MKTLKRTIVLLLLSLLAMNMNFEQVFQNYIFYSEN